MKNKKKEGFRVLGFWGSGVLESRRSSAPAEAFHPKRSEGRLLGPGALAGMPAEAPAFLGCWVVWLLGPGAPAEAFVITSIARDVILG
jgi:hypothetical protein